MNIRGGYEVNVRNVGQVSRDICRVCKAGDGPNTEYQNEENKKTSIERLCDNPPLFFTCISSTHTTTTVTTTTNQNFLLCLQFFYRLLQLSYFAR